MDLSNKKVLVTGATGGIGQALTTRLAAEGAHLLLNCLNAEALAETVVKTGKGHHMVVADVSTAEGRAKIVTAASDFGVECVINLAGILDFSLFEDQEPALIEKLLMVNLTGPMLLCHQLLPLLRQSKEAVIMNVGSTFGSIGYPGFVAYCASKAGLKHFSEALGRELADTPVRVQYVAPRATATKLNSDRVNEMNRALANRSDTPEWVAGQILAQLQSGRRSNFLGWPEKFFVKLNGLLPGLVHRALVSKLGVIRAYAKQ